MLDNIKRTQARTTISGNPKQWATHFKIRFFKKYGTQARYQT